LANNMMPALAQLLGQQQSLASLGGAYDRAQGRYATNYLDPYSTAAQGAPSMLGDSLGLGGAEGTRRAQEAFTAGPGYQFALDQGLQALNRSAASRGMLASGNNTQDILRFSQGLAGQEFGNWQNRLGDFSQLGLGAAQGQTGRQSSLAALDYGYGQDQAGIYTNTANRLADLAQPQQRQPSGIGSAIAGGLNLAGTIGGLALAPMSGGMSIPASSFAGQAIRNQLGHYFQR
jgi:hypothetical protein